jgi:3-deoxy-D-manno-octulosonic acid (KDO) 8-phosphate synthase
LKGEIWKDLEQFDGYYAISNFGRMKRYARLDSIGRKLQEKIIVRAYSYTKDNYIIGAKFTFGYNNLVFDLRVIPILHSMDIPVIFDGTHSAQLPGAAGNITGGQREFIPDLMRGAVSIGLEGLFMEVHPDPPSAKSDSTTQLYLNQAEELLTNLLKIDRLVKKEIL